MNIDERVLWLADECIRTKKTVRELAKDAGVSKTIVHEDLTKRLKELNVEKYSKVQAIFRNNQEEGRIKGGKLSAAHAKRHK